MLATLSDTVRPGEDLFDAYSRAIMGIAETVGPAVVRVDNRRAKGGGSGSGFVIAHDGMVLTNHHVVAGAKDLRLTLTDGHETPAMVVG